MRQYMFKHKFLLVTTVLVRCIGAAMQVYIALLIQQLIDYVVGGDMNGFVKAILFAAVYLGAKQTKYKSLITRLTGALISF